MTHYTRLLAFSNTHSLSLTQAYWGIWGQNISDVGRKWFVILHWTISETTLLFPEPSLLVAWQEYSPQREMSIQKFSHQSHYFVRNL